MRVKRVVLFTTTASASLKYAAYCSAFTSETRLTARTSATKIVLTPLSLSRVKNDRRKVGVVSMMAAGGRPREAVSAGSCY